MFVLGKQWITLIDQTEDAPAVEVLVGPITRPVTTAARLALRAVMPPTDEAETDAPAPSEEDEIETYIRVQEAYVRAIARGIIFDWRGVGKGADDTPAPFDKTLLDDLFDHEVIQHNFDQKVIRPYMEMRAEKNVSSPSPNGSTPRAA